MRGVPDSWIIDRVFQPVAQLIGPWGSCYNISRVLLVVAVTAFIANARLWAPWSDVNDMLFAWTVSFWLGYLMLSLLRRVNFIEQLSMKTMWAEGRHLLLPTRLFFWICCVGGLLLQQLPLGISGGLMLMAVYFASCANTSAMGGRSRLAVRY